MLTSSSTSRRLSPAEDTSRGAFEAGERRRSRVLLDLLGESAAEIRGDADSRLLEEERGIQRSLNANEWHRRELLSRKHEAEAVADLDKEQHKLHEDLDRVRNDLRQSSPRYTSLARPQTASLEEVQKRLLRSSRTILLSYSLGEERSFLWRISRKSIASYVLPGREEIEKAAADAQHFLKEARESAKPTQELHLNHLSEILLRPVAGRLEDGQRLLIVADGALLTFPFATLPKPGTDQPLIAEHEIVYLPSASVLLALRREVKDRDAAPKQLAIYADPVVSSDENGESPLHAELRQSAGDFETESFEPLPYARQEADAIWEIARGEKERWLGVEASKINLLHVDDLRDYQILHFATHGLLNRSQPNLSGLVLSLYDEHGKPQDGFLRLHEIYNLDLNAELVVLSSCASGLGTLYPGEGLLGLSRGFMYAGSPRVLVSLWNVNDEATAELMKRFYWSLLEAGASPSLALRAAQESMREEEKWRHPYYWAPFVLVGEWRRPEVDEPPIEEADAGDDPDDEADVDYPGPDEEWCDSLPEPWMRDLCKTLRRLGKPRRPRATTEQIGFNGIDASTGEDLQDPLSDRQLTSRILGPRRDRAEEGDLRWWNRRYEKTSTDRSPAEDVDPLDLASSGWGVIFVESASDTTAIREALRPLLEHRKEQAGDRYDDLVYKRGETKDAFLRRNKVEQGPAHPDQLPYYLLIVGSPEDIPYRFQYLLDLQYGVGRLFFEDVESYARYAESVVAVERDDRHDVLPEMRFFSVAHEDDAATQISERRLVRPLHRHLSRERDYWDIEWTPRGQKDGLTRLLGGDETPALLFTATHGVGYRRGHSKQMDNQGAILCQDWPGRGNRLKPEHYFAAADLGENAKVQGLIAFFFGCYSAGTPQHDNFPPAPLTNPIERAPRPFLSPLARRLLSHPNGSALAVLGHVDRTWTRSFGTGRGMGYLHFVSLLKRLLDGHPVGSAMDWMNERFAEISTELTDVLDTHEEAVRFQGRTGAAPRALDRAQLAGLWRANNDARNFVVLGDPAVRLAARPQAALLEKEARQGDRLAAGNSLPYLRTDLEPWQNSAGAVSLPLPAARLNTPLPRDQPGTIEEICRGSRKPTAMKCLHAIVL